MSDLQSNDDLTSMPETSIVTANSYIADIDGILAAIGKDLQRRENDFEPIFKNIEAAIQGIINTSFGGRDLKCKDLLERLRAAEDTEQLIARIDELAFFIEQQVAIAKGEEVPQAPSQTTTLASNKQVSEKPEHLQDADEKPSSRMRLQLR